VSSICPCKYCSEYSSALEHCGAASMIAEEPPHCTVSLAGNMPSLPTLIRDRRQSTAAAVLPSVLLSGLNFQGSDLHIAKKWERRLKRAESAIDCLRACEVVAERSSRETLSNPSPLLNRSLTEHASAERYCLGENLSESSRCVVSVVGFELLDAAHLLLACDELEA
jgi:hypothetical protein